MGGKLREKNKKFHYFENSLSKRGERKTIFLVKKKSIFLLKNDHEILFKDFSLFHSFFTLILIP